MWYIIRYFGWLEMRQNPDLMKVEVVAGPFLEKGDADYTMKLLSGLDHDAPSWFDPETGITQEDTW